MNEETKPRVLLVDDERAVRTWLKAMLIGLGCEIVGEGENGREAIDLFKAQRPDLIVMDIHMPEVDGRMALSLIPAGGGLPVAGAMGHDLHRGAGMLPDFAPLVMGPIRTG